MKEIRCLSASIRAESESRTIVGLIPFFSASDPGTQYELWEGFVERIMPTAFDRSLADNEDVRALAYHNADQPLGRRSAGTLALSKQAAGLEFRIDVAPTTAGNDLLESTRRGDVSGASFGFVARKAIYVEDETRGETIRELHDVQLMEVSPVVWPAYTSSTVSARDRQAIEAERRREEQRRKIVRRAGTLIKDRMIRHTQSRTPEAIPIPPGIK